MKSDKLNLVVFLPSIVLFIVCIIFALINNELFVASTRNLYAWIQDQFGWLFILTAVVAFVICIGLYFSAFGETVIGGKDSQPFLTKWSWFSITLCTTIGSGIIFWGAAEPVQHILNPPASSGIEAMSGEAILFAMATVFRHWTVLPYALYTLVAVVFAFAYYNMKQPFSLGSVIAPLVPEEKRKIMSNIIDFICVFSLVVGLAGSLYGGVLSINGGLTRMFGLESNFIIWALIIILISVVTAVDAISGINKGIRYLSNINVYLYFFILFLILIFGGMNYIFGLGIESIGTFIMTFFKDALFTGIADNDSWAKDWTIFYFGNWMAWTPITAVFLGRISYGRKVKEVIAMNLFVTSAFGFLWFIIISGATVNSLINDTSSGIVEAFNSGYENVIYQLFANLHLDKILTPVYLISVLISFITAYDSTTIAISGICSKGIAPDSADPPSFLIIIWISVIAFVTWIMMLLSEGIEGMKILANIGGLPSMFLILIVVVSAVLIAKKMKKSV